MEKASELAIPSRRTTTDFKIAPHQATIKLPKLQNHWSSFYNIYKESLTRDL